MSKIEDWIAERRRIHDAATEGPWAIGSWRDRTFQHHMTIEPEVGSRTIGDVTDDHQGNATAIVDAHNALPTLLTAAEKVLELHQPEYLIRDGEWRPANCAVCEPWTWPCLTVQAIEGAPGE